MNISLSDLNEQQRQACQMPPEPVLVLAGPGTGKTRVLIARILWTITHHQVQPENILALTFTNKAASEIKQRLLSLSGSQGENVWTGTIHGFALQILRKYHDRLGLHRHFSVCDSVYQNHLIQELCARYIRENLEAKTRAILLAFSNHMILEKPLPPFAEARYQEYENYLSTHNLIDFNQILIFCRRLLAENHDILSQYQHLYQAILIDEFQDTDNIQYTVLKMLASKHRNIFVVADDDQSIYTWRGASPENIHKYITDFKIEEPVQLRINYRSGHKIVDAANRVIEKTERLEREKPLEINEQIENEVAIHFFYTEQQEIDFLIRQIREWIDLDTSYRDIAIIYPFHRIGQKMEQFFVQNRIPYQMARGQSLLDHLTIRKILLYLRLTLDPDDYIALEDLTEQEIGHAFFNIIKEHARQQKCTFRKALYMFYRNRDKRFGYDMSARVQKFVMQLGNLINLRDFYRFDQLMSDIYQYVKDGMTVSLEGDLAHMEDITELINSEPDLKLFDPRETYGILHEDPKIVFLARKFLLKTGISIAEPNERASKFIALTKPKTNEPDHTFIPVYRLQDENRRSGMTCLFKYLQWQLTGQNLLDSFVVLDLETTDRDPDKCDIVELAAVRVRNGEIVEEITTLIKPDKPISQGAQAVHGIKPEDVENKPSLKSFWPKLRSFIGEDILIAHNGFNFDFPILDRMSRKLEGIKLPNARYDSLVLARSLFPGESNSIDSLIDRFHLTAGNRHRALEDVKILVTIFQNLQNVRDSNARKTSLEMFLDIVSLGAYIENKIDEREDRIFFIGGARKLITPYAETLLDLSREFELDERNLAAAINDQLERLQPGFHRYGQDENLLIRLREMASKFNPLPVKEATAAFLGQLALQQAQDELNDINAVSLLTYHAAKGLEFDKVILIGLEKDNMPGFHATRTDEEDDRPVLKKLEEQRRLFYVGMTRAKSELIMTAVRNRGGWERQSSPFLKDLKIKMHVVDGIV